MTQNIIEEIASKHLGKAGDGTVVKPYVTPEHVDSSLLVGIPRYLNREQYNISNTDFKGFDAWYAYEVSVLLQNGMPLNFILRIEYPSNSECIVESKSFKLYLNSFNLMRINGAIPEVIETVKNTIETDLSKTVNGKVTATLTTLGYNNQYNTCSSISFSGCVSINATGCVTSSTATSNIVNLEQVLMNTQGFNILDTEFDTYTETPELIKINPTSGYEIIKSFSLRSNCRVTNQPDWGDIYIAYSSNMSLDYVGLMKYIVSMRKENHFHEEICEAVYKRLISAFDKAGAELNDLAVLCNYFRRGGIDIRPMRYMQGSLMQHQLRQYTTNNYKTERQ